MEDASLPLTSSVEVDFRLSVELATAELEGLPDALAEVLMRALLVVLVIVVWVVWVASVVPPVVEVLWAEVVSVVPVVVSVLVPVVVPVVAPVVVPVASAVEAAVPVSDVVSFASGTSAAGLPADFSRAV